MKITLVMAVAVVCLTGFTSGYAVADDTAVAPTSLQNALNQEAQTNHERVFTKEYQDKLDSTQSQSPSDSGNTGESTPRNADHAGGRFF